MFTSNSEEGRTGVRLAGLSSGNQVPTPPQALQALSSAGPQGATSDTPSFHENRGDGRAAI